MTAGSGSAPVRHLDRGNWDRGARTYENIERLKSLLAGIDPAKLRAFMDTLKAVPESEWRAILDALRRLPAVVERMEAFLGGGGNGGRN